MKERRPKPGSKSGKPGGARKPSRGGARPPARKPGGRKPGSRAPTRGPSRTRAIKVTPLAADTPTDGKVRLNRFLAQSGVCSRREADAHIAAGRVHVNGEVVRELGTRIDPHTDDVRHDGERIREEPHVYVLFNKPKGVVCTNARNEQRTRVIDYLPEVKGRVYTVGRLDADSEGLILLTNDGDFAQRVAHPSFGLAKTYAVLVQGRVEPEVVQKAQGGVWLSDGKTSGSRVVVERRGRDRTYMKVSIREGRNREIRRVFSQLGHPVISLKRVRIGKLSLHGLGQGRYRFLKKDEVHDLLALTGGDSTH